MRILVAATTTAALFVCAIAATATGIMTLLNPQKDPETAVVTARQTVMFMEGNPKRVIAVFLQEDGMRACQVFKASIESVVERDSGLRCEIREMDVVVETNKM